MKTHHPNCAVVRAGNLRAYCDCGIEPTGMTAQGNGAQQGANTMTPEEREGKKEESE